MLRLTETRRNEATMVTSVKEISCATVKPCPDCCEWLLFCLDKYFQKRGSIPSEEIGNITNAKSEKKSFKYLQIMMACK